MFDCSTPFERIWTIIGYAFTICSALFTLHKLRITVRERVQRLQAASIRPTLKRIVFVERALADHSKHMLLTLADRAGALGESGLENDGDAVHTVRALYRQLTQLQEQQQQQRQEMQQLMQQQQQHHEQQLQLLRQEMLQLTQQLQRLQQ
jgi:DNA anti-recombination protein RmuC